MNPDLRAAICHESCSHRADCHSRWQNSLADELAWWDEWLRTQGGGFPDDFIWKTDPSTVFHKIPYLQPEEQQRLFDCLVLPTAPGATLRILDVGAGPMTILGKNLDVRSFSIVAVDPMADSYSGLLSKHGIVPGVPTRPGEAEKLIQAFGENCFDLVFARNCIDHGYDPVLAITQMIAVLKPGHYVYMAHALNEGVRAEYNGLHQWNFEASDGKMFIWNPEVRISLADVVRDVAEPTVWVKDDWVFTTLRKGQKA